MPVTALPSTRLKYDVGKKIVDFSADTLRICLMASGFVFDPTTQFIWTDVSGSELPTGGGYIQNTLNLSGGTWTENDGSGLASRVFSTASWLASGSGIGPTPGAIIYDISSSEAVIIGYINFGGNQTTVSGGTFAITGITVQITS